MDVREKAKDIYDKMKGFRVKNSHRKKCALICVDEIIDSLNKTEEVQQHPIGIWKAKEYWSKVRTEIEKI